MTHRTKHLLCLTILVLAPAVFVTGICHSVLTGSYGWAYGFVAAFIVVGVAFVVDLLKP